MNRTWLLILCCFGFVLFSVDGYASKSKPFQSQQEADDYLTIHFGLGCNYYNLEEWSRAATEFEKVIYFFPSSETAGLAFLYLGVCYFEMREYDFANVEFSNYLKASDHPEFFEEVVHYKFCIAEYFKRGKKRRFLKARYLPKWASAYDLALTIYDEVIAALPNHSLAIRALYSKAQLLERMGEYADAIETYQIIIRRFPRHEIVPISYLNIAKIYLKQSRLEFQNPDILALAELNVRKFRQEFPRDERVLCAESYVAYIKELYAKGLSDIGLFYERTNQPNAAAIYYQSSIEEFPDTQVAQFCQCRLICLGYPLPQEEEAVLNETTSAPTSQIFQEPEKNTAEKAPQEEAPKKEYSHYSLFKKRKVSYGSSGR